MVAIAILGIGLTIAIPEFNHVMQRQKLNNEAQQLAGAMRLARQEAITTGQKTRVDFFYFADCYAVKNKARHYFPAGISYKAQPSFKHKDEPELYCTFVPSGAPSPTGSVCLTNQNGDLKWVIVNLATGRIRVSDIPPKK